MARRLSYAAEEDNGVTNLDVNNSLETNVSNDIGLPRQRYAFRQSPAKAYRRRTVWNTADESDSEVRLGTTLFPKIVCFTLAVVAACFLFGRSVTAMFSLPLTAILYPLLVSLLLGVLCIVLSWMITFSDSLEPGSNPPSPISPQKFRKRSGHTFHSNYVVCIANGVIVFAVSLWYFSG